jgi:hypothetical protein
MGVDRRRTHSAARERPGGPIAPSHHKYLIFISNGLVSCAIVVIIDKMGAWLLRHTMLISRRTAEQSEDRTWRTSAPKLDPWYMFPIKSRPAVGRPNTPLTCITALCPHETLPRVPKGRGQVNAGKEPPKATRARPMADRPTGRERKSCVLGFGNSSVDGMRGADKDRSEGPFRDGKKNGHSQRPVVKVRSDPTETQGRGVLPEQEDSSIGNTER